MKEIKRISRNIKLNAAGQAINLIVAFAMFPFIVSYTGKEVYGAYILVTTVTGYLGILDFGTAGAVIKYVAEYSGKGDMKGTGEILSTSITFYMIIGLVGAIILFIFSRNYELLFTVKEANQQVVTNLFLIAAVASLIIWPGRTFEWGLQGFQSYGWIAIMTSVGAILLGLSAYLIFTNGLGITYFLAVYYIIMASKQLASYIIVNRRLVGERIRAFYFNKRVWKTIFSFSFYIFLASLTNIIIFQVDNIIIGTLVSVAAVTLYNVAGSLQNAFRFLNSTIGGPLFPVCADLEGRSEHDKQKVLLFKGTKYMALVFVPMVLITIIFAGPLITNWMGEGFYASILVTQVLISFWLFNSVLEVGSSMLTAKGFTKYIFVVGVINAVINLTMSLILSRYIGILGVALAVTVPMVLVSAPLILRKVFRVFDISLREYFSKTIKSHMVLYILTVALSLLVYKVSSHDNIFVVLFEMAAIYFSILIAGYYISLSAEEKREVSAMVGF